MSAYQEQLLVGRIPHEHAALHSRKAKLAVVAGTARLTWADVSSRTARLANFLRSAGVRRGDHVAVVLQNRAEYVEVIYAVAGLGATVVPISYRFVAREIAYALRLSDSVAAIVDGHLAPVFAEANSEAGIPADRVLVLADDRTRKAGPGYVDYGEALAASVEDTGYLAAEEWDVYHLAFTGGTTGYPKACEVPQRIAWQNWAMMTAEFGILEHDVTLIAGPFYHGLGFMWGLQQLMVGGTVVMLPAFSARRVLETIQAERVTWTPMAPTMYSMILEEPGKDSFDVSSMRGLVSAAAPLLTPTKEGLLAYFTRAGLFEYYGATEAGFYSVLKPADQLRKVRCVGEPFGGTELRILDTNGNEVPAGEVGIIYKRGLCLGARYYKDPAATDEAFRGEWMTSGDLGWLDAEGYLYVVGRAKDMIISGGVNIFPAEIEEVLSAHPGVVQCAVVGAPDERWGEVVTAFIVARGPGNPGELDSHCGESLARYKRPRAYHFVDTLPQNSSGKILKRDLREWLSRNAAPHPPAGSTGPAG